MTAKEARKLVLQRGYNEIWNSLPESIKRSIEDAVNHMRLTCEVDISLLSGLVRQTLRQLGYTVHQLGNTKYYISWIN